jgi:hypothetical protein
MHDWPRWVAARKQFIFMSSYRLSKLALRAVNDRAITDRGVPHTCPAES